MPLDVQLDVEQIWQESLLKFVMMGTQLTIKDVPRIVEVFLLAGIVKMEDVVLMIVVLLFVEIVKER